MYIYCIPIQIYYGDGEILIIYTNMRRLAIDKWGGFRNIQKGDREYGSCIGNIVL